MGCRGVGARLEQPAQHRRRAILDRAACEAADWRCAHGTGGRALLPLAVVVAISPVPIVAVILMLLTPKAGGTSVGFLAGWVAGIAGVTTMVLLAGDPGPGSGRSSVAASWVELALGGLLLALAARQWWSRPRRGAEPGAPQWLAAIDRFTAVQAGGLGLVLSAVNPKILLVCVAAGLVIAGGGLSGAEDAWSVVAFTGLAASTVAVPVAAYAVGRRHMAGALESLRRWLTAHSAVVTATLLLVIGVILIGQGLGGLV
jgi:Sap, sulfolipid-1-addressing protein